MAARSHARNQRRTAQRPDARTAVIAAALRVAEQQGWVHATLADIADETELSLAALHELFPSRAAILAAFLRDVDGEMLARVAESDAGDSPRDRLFAVVMARLDALRPYRGAVVSIGRAALTDCPTACVLTLSGRRTLPWMLAAAGIRHQGITGELLMQGLGAVVASTLWVWARDDSDDLAKTMAHLDRQLRRAEWLFQLLRSAPRPLEPLRRRRAARRARSA